MKNWYSIRMRSSMGGPHEDGGRHISGAERLIDEGQIETTAIEMIRRATTHSRGEADYISLKLEKINNNSMEYIPPLRVKKVENSSQKTTKKIISEQLTTLAIDQDLLFSLYDWMIQDDRTRGAIIVDINSGKRLDPNDDRGVRVSHFDWDKTFKEKFIKHHPEFQLERRAEAIALASKVAAAGTICELCCSDDPEYTAGYISYQNTFYRIPHMKISGSPRGGRVFMIDSTKMDLDSYISYLEKTPVLIGGV